MAEFLLIVPPGWSEFSDINDLINTGATPSDLVSSWIAQESWDEFNVLLISAAHDVGGQVVIGAKLFLADTGYRLWLKFV